MKTNKIFQIALAVVIVGLAVLLYNSIMKPVRFDNEYNQRRDAVVVKLKEIRNLQEAYKMTYGCYANDMDSLILGLQEGKLPVVKKYGNVPDEMTEAEALKQGIIRRDTVFMNPLEKMREEKKTALTDAQLAQLKYVPYTDNQTFEMRARFVEKSGFEVPVFEAKVHLSVLLADLDEQDVNNKIAQLEDMNRYPGWKVGDYDEPITDGNFE
ncbi:MAG: hypothetical protein IKY22_10340 [Bacteroidales bacterium]|nr:hypothetical protein [Bacteroidales bacterium]MBR5778843.1 hypothetical protein [Bacteroidales bacterium]MBR5784472.1 hypothetical protein [Bacteroidales bacterium]